MRNLISVILSLVLGVGVAYADDLHREGSTHVSGSTGNFPMCVVNELATALGAEGQYIGQACTAEGVALSTLTTAAGAGLSIPVSGATNLEGFGTLGIVLEHMSTDTAEAGSTTTVINATAHVARVGDIIEMTTGTATNIGMWAPVSSVATNAITVSRAFASAVTVGDQFLIKRPRTPTYPSSSNIAYFSYPVNLDINAQGNTARGLLKAEDAASASGDVGVAALGVVNTAGSTFTSTGGDYTNIATTTTGAVQCHLDYNHVASGATNFLKLEDVAAASGDAGSAVLAYYSQSPQTALAADGDYGWLKANLGGSLFVDVNVNGQVNNANGLLKQEDVATAAGDALVGVAARVKGDFNASAGDGDYGHFNVDLDGRLATNPWGADTSDTGSSCGTATASTADVAIKAGVASNRIYVGSITCSSSDADNATNINFKDGSTVMAVGGVSQMATASDGSFVATFSPPLRGTVNTAFNFNTAVSTSSVICCANWFISAN